MAYGSEDVRRLLLQWLTTFGPFLDDDRQAEPDDYFEFEGADVTDQGLGEAARREKYAESAGVFSFISNKLDFARSPLQVQHGLAEEPFGFFDIANVWDLNELEQRAKDALPEPTSWDELIQYCRQSYDRLTIPDSVLDRLSRETFYPTVAHRTVALLRVLQAMMEGRNPNDGKLSPGATELRQDHFVGEKAWFTDESHANKANFARELTFPDPDDSTTTIFCPWHGKIKTPQFRVHFQWPVPVGQEKLNVVYIGPKITKD